MTIVSAAVCLALLCVSVAVLSAWLAGVLKWRGLMGPAFLTPGISVLAQYCLLAPLAYLFTGPDTAFVTPWQGKPGGFTVAMLFTVVPWISQLAIVFTCWALLVFWENWQGSEPPPAEIRVFGDVAAVAAAAAWVLQAVVGVPWR